MRAPATARLQYSGAMRWVWLAMLAGCYHADTPAGSPCISDAECPGGQTCAAQHCSLANGAIFDGALASDAPADTAVMPDATPLDAPAPPPLIQYKTTTSATVLQNAPATSLSIARPSCAGGEMIASIAMGTTGAATLPVYTAPAGWTLVRRSDRNTDSSLAVYTHAASTADPATFTWTFDLAIEGVGWISCYANVDRADPIDVETGGALEEVGPIYTAPTLTTTGANEMIVGIIVAHRTAGATTWTTSLTERIDLNNTTTRSGMAGDRRIANPGSTGTITTTASAAQDYAIGELLVLRQAP